jgi:hypothetical protein
MGAARLPSVRRDVVVGLLLLGVTVVYLAALPHNLGLVDESDFLYEARRVADGEVLYRDIFEWVTPLSWYVMAAVYWLFGTDMGVARMAMAVVHGVTVIAIYLACRAVQVRTSLAAAVALAFVAVCQPPWPYASPHWFSTCVTALLFLLCLSPRWRHARWCFVLGVVNGILIGVQQQKGSVMAAGVAVLLLLVHLTDQRFGPAESWRQLGGRMAAFAAGVLLIVVPLLAPFVVLAGPGSMFRALVRFPLVNYRRAFYAQWGQVPVGFTSAPFPALLRDLPLVFAALLPRMIVDWLRRRHRERLRMTMVVTVFAASSLVSIAYYPDLIHIAFTAPVFFVAIALAMEWALALGPRRLATVGGPLLAFALLGGVAWQFQRTMTRSWREYPVAHDTRFGRIDFRDDTDLVAIDIARTMIEQSPNKEVFCYPSIAAPYLMTGGRNPTPYQYFIPTRLNDPEQFDEILNILEARQVPMVILVPMAGRQDPFGRYLSEHYDFVPTSGMPHYWLFTRKHMASTPSAQDELG